MSCREEPPRRRSSMDTADHETPGARRGSYDDAATSLRPHFRHLAQRRRSAPSLVFGKALGMPWSPIREEEAPCWVSVEQSPFVLGLTSENGQLLLDESVQVCEGARTQERHLFLFSDVLVFAKLRSTASYRLKRRVNLEELWLHGFEDEPEDEEDAVIGDLDVRLTVVLAWELNCCLVCFCSPEVKQHWLDTLHRVIWDAKVRAGSTSSPPDVLMKVLSGSVATKTLTGGGMDPMIDLPFEGDAKLFPLPRPLSNQDERPTQTAETKWNLVRKMKFRKGSHGKPSQTEAEAGTQLFGQPLSRICPDDHTLPKPVTDLLVLLRKRGPSTEGIFRKPCNSKNMKDMREQLNSGLDVDMEGQPVVLLVGLLKSFLKELPGSLLRSELYSSWMTALDNEDTQQRAAEISRVVGDLPAPNRLLLQHVVCVLHHIAQRADANMMTASNLAVCIGPTLLQLDDTPLDGQREAMQKVSELTQFLIENCEVLGENIPGLLDTDGDSLSSLHHDSAYDSTDPDGDGDAGEKVNPALVQRRSSSSCSSLSPGATNPSWQFDGASGPKSQFSRRCSEPILLLTPDLERLRDHARSHDDCSMERADFDEQPLTKQTSDDSFLLRRRGATKSSLLFPKLNNGSFADPLHFAGKDCSCSSLESTASNQSEGSVFVNSPLGSPGCIRRPDPTHTSVTAKTTHQDIPKPITDEKKRSQSMRITSKVLMRTRSLGAFGRSSLKKDSQKENAFPCETLPEDSQSEADPSDEVLLRPRPQSAIEVFKRVDSRLPSEPPSYDQAVLNLGAPPQYESLTVHDAIKLERRSRPSSVNFDFSGSRSPRHSVYGQEGSVEMRQPFRPRAMSESVSGGHQEVLSRRCSQPVFEEFSYAKESYV